MALTFADTHNMIAFLTKSDASDGFEQIIDFLNASVIQYALMQVQDDVDDVAENEDAANEISVKPTLPSPTPASTPPPQQECIPLPSQKDGNLEQDKIAQAIEITKLKQRVKGLENKRKLKASGFKRLKKFRTPQRVESSADIVMDDQEDTSKQRGREIAELDTNEDITLQTIDAEDADVQGRLPQSQAQVYHLDLEHADKVLSMQDDEVEPDKVKEAIVVVTAAKLMTEVVTAATTTITDALLSKESALRRRCVIIQDLEEAATASLSVQSEVKSKDKGNPILVEEPKPLKRRAQIEQDEASARELEAKINANINWNEVIEQVKRKEKQTIQRKGDRRRGKQEESKSSEQKAAKKQRIDEEVEELKTHLQIFPNDEDDVYTEATRLALKVLVVDYQIHTIHNKPYYKIIRADRTHQLFLSFTSLLRNFDREDLEMMWKIVQEKFAYSEPKNFLDDFLLNTLKTMFEKPNVKANIWKNQRGSYGLAKVKS
nr:hypothetical protein [Tanacetum cinerariifolium]